MTKPTATEQKIVALERRIERLEAIIAGAITIVEMFEKFRQQASYQTAQDAEKKNE